MKKKMPSRRRHVSQKSKGRSRLTNQNGLLATVDGRSVWARRFRDIVGLLSSDLGNEPAALSEGQRQLVRRCACISIELEHLEDRFAANNGAKLVELEAFQRASNSLRRLVECLGISRGRIARDVTPTLQEYLQTHYSARANGAAEAEP